MMALGIVLLAIAGSLLVILLGVVGLITHDIYQDQTRSHS